MINKNAQIGLNRRKTTPSVLRERVTAVAASNKELKAKPGLGLCSKKPLKGN